MGYYVRTTDSNARLSPANMPEAFDALVALNERDEWKSGGSFSGGNAAKVWFAWMPEDYPSQVESVYDILQLVGYDCKIGDDGYLILGDYDNKTGCEEIFVWAISTLFEAGSYVEWVGEDGNPYRWEFGGGKPLQTSLGRVVYDEFLPYEPYNWELFRKALDSAVETTEKKEIF